MSRIVLVTGASSGIGRAVALSLARRGDTLVLIARRQALLEKVASECRQAGGEAQACSADVRDADAVRSVVDGAVERFGRLDAALHVAGVAAYGRFEDIPPDVFNGVLDTNVGGALNIARATLPVFRQQQAGHLLLVGSVLGEINVPFMTPYVVSKWAVRGLARQLALENRDLPQVRISCVSPGGVDTSIYGSAANYLGRQGQPPPPVSSPQHVADKIVRTLDRPRDRVTVGPLNPLMRLGFSVVPGVFDALVGPLFRLIALERGAVAPTEGNVLTPPTDGEN